MIVFAKKISICKILFAYLQWLFLSKNQYLQNFVCLFAMIVFAKNIVFAKFCLYLMQWDFANNIVFAKFCLNFIAMIKYSIYKILDITALIILKYVIKMYQIRL